jgi:hypothetical protein
LPHISVLSIEHFHQFHSQHPPHGQASLPCYLHHQTVLSGIISQAYDIEHMTCLRKSPVNTTSSKATTAKASPEDVITEEQQLQLPAHVSLHLS